ncbi:LPS assembly protein LptD [Candidatus Pantoea carbekii]|uniref:LPS assembly protein LptD n=1 Tax=Candidatus Pantoea carbekii TaxID=1235990 RepID=UPI00061874DA|nr:LPS assembly protein LptD [Candidatus Pantoea carbekii]AKC31944.1 organic solvent tolerance protein precursor Lmp [Candidatus Pantoea carbekii]
MKKNRFILLIIAINIILYSQCATSENLISHSVLEMLQDNFPLLKHDMNKLPVTINSDSVKGKYPNILFFNGNVDIKQGKRHFHADEVQLNQHQNNKNITLDRTMRALGNVYYDDEQIFLQGEKAWGDLNNKDINVFNVKYQMVGKALHGIADEIQLRDYNRYIILKKGSFTSCFAGFNSWNMTGSEIIQDNQEEITKIWNAYFKLGNVPIFYSPYFQLPTGNRRLSGFLLPTAKFSKNNGLQLITPYYWNIRPEVDVTMTPYYYSKRGLLLQNELRYLTQTGTSLVNLHYLLLNKQYDSNTQLFNTAPIKNKKFNRWLYYFNHVGVFKKHWFFNANYAKVSDEHYFSDFELDDHYSTKGYLPKKFSIKYANTNWDITFSSQDYQKLPSYHNHDSTAYRAISQFDLNFYPSNVRIFNGCFYAQVVRLVNTNNYMPEAIRFHVEPTLNIPFSRSWASVNTEAKLLVTHYEQYCIDHYKNQDSIIKNISLKRSVNRVIPKFKIDGRLIFDRKYNLNMPWKKNIIQVIEPHIQYAYIPYQDQNNIYPYDSTLFQANYSNPFHEYNYSGLDRISAANKITSSVTTHLYNNNLDEFFNFSLGQIYHFTPHNNQITQINDHTNTLWMGNAYWKINNRWHLRSGFQYNMSLNKVFQGNTSLEYHYTNHSMLQLNYRYSSPEYIESLFNNIELMNHLVYKKGISQIGTIASWPIANTWFLVGSYYYDNLNNKSLEQMLGVQYRSCCYSVRFGYERKINGLKNNNSQYDQKISLNIELRGIGSDSDKFNIRNMLQQCAIPYQHIL